MKKYVVKFASAVAAHNYGITYIPFMTSVAPSSGYPIQNLTCNQTNKKLVNNNGSVSVYVNIPDDEIWYTTTDGEPIDLSGGGSGSGSGSGSGADWPEYEILPYEGGKGVIKFTEDLTEIPSNGFKGIGNLETIILPNSVTSIGDAAFFSCENLTSVVIPDSVISIGEGAFVDVFNIEYHGSATGSPWGAKCVNGYVEGNLVYQDSTKTTLEACKRNATGSIIIPNSVTSIGNSAFSGCSGLTSVTIPNSVTSIGNSAFWYCSGLTSVTIPNSVTSIGEYAFYGCSGLTSVTIPNSVTSIGNYAFYDCSGLTSVTIPNNVTSIGKSAFSGCSGLTSVIIDSDTLVNKSYSASPNFKNIFGSQVTNYVIGNSVTGIGQKAFNGCTNLTFVTIGNSVTNIGQNAFNGCTNLISVTINSDTLVNKSYSAYSNIKNIFGSQVTNYVIGDSVTSIGNHAFDDCSSLTSVTISNSVTSIGEYAFEYCSSLTSVTCEATIPPILLDGVYVFYDTNNCPIYVPSDSVETYKSSWKYYKSRIQAIQ